MKTSLIIFLAAFHFLIPSPESTFIFSQNILFDSLPEKRKNKKFIQSNYSGINRGNRIFLSVQLSPDFTRNDSAYFYLKDFFSRNKYQIISEEQFSSFFRAEVKYISDKALNQTLKTKKQDQFQTEALVKNHNYRLQKLYISIKLQTANDHYFVEEFKWKTVTITQKPYDTLKILPLQNFVDRSIENVCRSFVDSVKLYNK